MRSARLCDYGLLPAEVAAPCATSRSCVPLSRCTVLLVDVISEPCVLFDAAEVRLSPPKPNTPRLSEVNRPAPSTPPPAPLVVPAAVPVTFGVELTAPSATPPTFAAVLVTVPAVAPAVDPNPPSAAPPDARPPAVAPPTAPPLAGKSS